jgi:hypothetical protein
LEASAIAEKDAEKIDEELENKLLEDDEVVAEPEVDQKVSSDPEETAKEIEELDKVTKDLEEVTEELGEGTKELEEQKEVPVENSTEIADEASKTLEPQSKSEEVPMPTEKQSVQEVPQSDATKSHDEDDDLLEACDSPKKAQQPEAEDNQLDDASVISSTPDETPEESSDEKVQSVGNEEPKMEQQNEPECAEEKMDVDETEAIKTEEDPQEISDNDKEAEKQEVDEKEKSPKENEPAAEEPKEVIPIKLQFMKKFATSFGKISRPDLEELLVQKISESLMFCSENTELRARLEKQEKLCETVKKRLDNVVKQYNDLEMIHKRVMKDLKDRPDAPITPVKITRAVGLQVYQPQSRKTTPVSASPMFNIQATKRPIEDPQANGKSPENSMKKKKRITPLRPPLSATERASLEAMEAREEQKLRTNVSKSISNAPNVTLSPVANGGTKKPAPASLSQSIDLTDDLDEDSSSSKSGPQTPQPPALVAIRANNQQQRNAFVVKPPIIVPANSAAGRLVQFRSKLI